MGNAMEVFINNISSYPTVIFTGMVMFVVLFWMTSLLGLTEMDSFDLDVDMDIDLGADVGGDLGMDGGGDADIGSASGGIFTGVLLKFGLHGVPLVIIVSLISLIGWFISYFYTRFLHANFADGMLHYVFGTGAFIMVLVLSMWLTGLILAPIRKKIGKIPKRDSKSFIGQTAVVRTFTVDDKHGEATLEDGGAGLIFKVRAMDGNTFAQHDKVVLVEYIAEENAYRVVAESEYLG